MATPAPAPQAERAPEETLGLDKFKEELLKLKDRVEVSRLEDFETGLKQAFLTDMEEIKIEGEEAETLWTEAWEKLKATPNWKEVIAAHVEDSKEKTELDAFVENIENLTRIQQAIEEKRGSGGVFRQLFGGLEKAWNQSELGKKIKWSVISAFMGRYIIKFAEAKMEQLKKEEEKGTVMSSMWRRPMYEWLAGMGMGLLPEKERYKQTAAAAFEKFKTAKFPIETFDAEGYGLFLKYYKNDQEKGEKAITAALLDGSPISRVRTAVEKHENLKGGKFTFVLPDVALLDPERDPDMATQLVAILEDKDETYALKNKDPKSLRVLMDALRTKKNLEGFRKSGTPEAETGFVAEGVAELMRKAEQKGVRIEQMENNRANYYDFLSKYENDPEKAMAAIKLVLDETTGLIWLAHKAMQTVPALKDTFKFEIRDIPKLHLVPVEKAYFPVKGALMDKINEAGVTPAALRAHIDSLKAS